MDENTPPFHPSQHFSERKLSSSNSSEDRTKKYIKFRKRRARPQCERLDNRLLNIEGEDNVKRRSVSSRLLTDFKTIRTIGKGGFGRVIEVINKIDNCVYAIKCIKLEQMGDQKKTVLTKEAELLSRLHHDNIVRYYCAFMDEIEETTENEGTEDDSPCSVPDDSNCNSMSPGSIYEENHTPSKNRWTKVLCIQMEFCQRTLADAISNHLWREHSKAWIMFWEIVTGLAYLHQNFVIHRDLKPLNIFLDAKGHIKIGDFGLATQIFRGSQIDEQVTESLSGEIGTSYYRAPELDNSGKRAIYGQEVDIYSLGIILFEMFNPPFNTLHERHDVLTKLRNPEICMPEEFEGVENNREPIYLLRCLLNHDTSSRPTSDALLHFQKNKLSSYNYELFQINIVMEKNNPLQPNNAFCNKIPNTESKHAYGHSV